MKSRKQFIIALVCIIALCAVFLGVSYFGNNLTSFMGNVTDVSSEKENTSQQETDKEKSKDEENKAKTTTTENTEEEKKNSEGSEKKDGADNAAQETKEGYYTVKSNDTLYAIARTYMPDHNTAEVVSQIRERNNLKETDPIITGQKLIISYETKLVQNDESEAAAKPEEKKGENKAADEKATTTSTIDHSKHVKYTVKSGDTLFSIAGQYFKNTNVIEAVNMIKADNNLTSDVIKVDQTLCIPSEQ